MLELNDDNFKAEIATGMVLVDFYGDACGPCRMVAPIIEQLAAELTDIKIAKIDVDVATNTTVEAGITGIPSLVIYKDGKEISRRVGAASKPVLLKWIEENKSWV